MRTLFKLSALVLGSTLLLASCGGGPTPDPDPKPEPEQPVGDTSPVPSGTINRPADATAAGEFVITGERATALAQALRVGPFSKSLTAQNLSAQNMQPQATDAELRVLLAVTRATSGTSAGKKKAVATFVWGNQAEQITAKNLNPANGGPAVTLDVYPQATPAALQTFKGALGLKVEAPNFQDKTTKSSPYIADIGITCARLVVNLTTLPNSADPKEGGVPGGYTPYLFNTSAAPLEVCEGQTEKDAEKVALEKAIAGLMYTRDSAAAAPWAFTRYEGEGVMTRNRLLELEKLPLDSAVTVQTVTEFFTPLENPGATGGTYEEVKAAQAVARKYTALRKQLQAYYQNLNVYRVKVANGRETIYVVGNNGFGAGGVKTVRFIP